ncbi:hypothetical protein KEM56_004140, partial [Ascosphaera pollenicola]
MEADGFVVVKDGDHPMTIDQPMEVDEDDDPRPSKRRRTSLPDELDKNRFGALTKYITLDLNAATADFNDFSEKLDPPLTGEHATDLLTQIGLLSCMGAGTLQQPPLYGNTDFPLTCSICDGIPVPIKDSAVWTSAEYDELRKAYLKVLPTLSDFVDARVTAASTMKKILMHCLGEEHLTLQSSPLGECSLQFLRSSIREIRIAATRTISAFMQKRLSPRIRRDNFMAALDYLQRMLDNQDAALKETAILALTRVAEVAGDKEMNIILLRLVEMLGHENPFLNDVAFSELFRLAEVLEMTPVELFKPFWRTITILAIVNMDSRPKILDQLCELTMMSLETFLMSAQEHVVPYLVSMRKYETIELIDPERRLSCFDICKREHNLTAILAFLLIQPSEDYETLVTLTFKNMSPESETHSLNEWVSIQGIEVTCELLRELGESTQENRHRYLQALTLVASLKPHRKSASSAKEGSVLALYIERNILGIIRIFSQIVNENS